MNKTVILLLTIFAIHYSIKLFNLIDIFKIDHRRLEIEILSVPIPP